VLRLSVLVFVLTAQTVGAQPDPQPAGKVDARALMQSGVKLLEAHDYLGALAIFKDAYARFPSAKILLNIGTTLALLDRKPDAANAYQKYVDSPDVDPTKRADVVAQLAELDKASGILELAVTPSNAEVLLDGTWAPVTPSMVWRVPPGDFSVQARAKGFEPREIHGTVVAAGHQPVAITLSAIVVPTTVAPEAVVVTLAPEPPRSRFGGFVVAHVSVVPKLGSAALLGASADITSRFAGEAAVILGPGLASSGSATLPPPKLGAYAGARFTLLPGSSRPYVAAGFPIFFDDGPRVFVRGAGGVELVVSRRLSFQIELGAEVDLNAQMDIRTFALVPAIGVVGRP
jgi:hypothetical protein